jgi:hypothetical protein
MSLTKNSKILLAGPWVGEFGWELFCWQGYIRKMSRSYDKTIVIGMPGNEYLYEDFCDEYIEFNPESYKTDAWKCYDCKSSSYLINTIEHTTYFSGNFDIGMRYTHNGVIDTKKLFFTEQEFFKYDYISDYGFDVIFHCRNKSTGSERNWDKQEWEKLYKSLPKDLKIACIGNNESFYIEGTENLRGINLKELVGVLKQSKIIVGPSSGPMHLASLCGLKHLVWSTEYNRIRYEKDWNPFNTKVIFYGIEDWNPKHENITELILKNI